VTHLHRKLAVRVDAATNLSFGRQELRVIAPFNTFAYPFDEHDNRTTSVVHRVEAQYAFTSHGGVFDQAQTPMRLGRLHIGSWNGDDFLRKIAGGSNL